MEAAKPVKHGGKYCVAGAGNNKSCTNTSYTPGISMHLFPSDPKIKEKMGIICAETSQGF